MLCIGEVVLICQVLVGIDLLIALQAENVFLCVKRKKCKAIIPAAESSHCLRWSGRQPREMYFFQRFCALLKFISSCLHLGCLLGRLITVNVLAGL